MPSFSPDRLVTRCASNRSAGAALFVALGLATLAPGCGTDEETPLAAIERTETADSAVGQDETPNEAKSDGDNASAVSGGWSVAGIAPTPIAATPVVTTTPDTRIESGAGAGFRNAPIREPDFPCGPFLGVFANYSHSIVEWTPDGSRLIFGFEHQLWVVDQTGRELRRLVDANPNPGPRRTFGFRDGFHADISPDGQQVVYTSCNHRSDDPIPALDGSIYEEGTPAWRERSHLNYELAVVDIDGGEPRRLTNDTRFDHFPAWSPDGSRIAFMSAPADRNPIEYYELQIYMTTPSGGGLQDGDLSYGYVKSGPLAWSPDGEHLAYLAGAPESYVMTVNTNASLRVVPSQSGTATSSPPADQAPTVGPDESMVPQSMVTEIGPSSIPPNWSPDGEWILTASGEGAEYALIAVRADGQARESIVTLSSIGVGAPVSEAAWSPDGSKIAFVAAGIWVVDADGRNAHHLLSVSGGLTPAGRGHVAWSPDSKQIAAYYSGAGQLHVISLENFEQRVLVTKDATGGIQAGNAVRTK